MSTKMLKKARPDQRIIVDGCIAVIDEVSVPRRVCWPDGIFVRGRDGKPLLFEDLEMADAVHTDAFGWLRGYTTPPAGEAAGESRE